MANMIIEYRVMPENGEIDISNLEEVTKTTVSNYDESVKVIKTEEVSVGFGLKAIKIRFEVDENKGSDNLEDQLKEKEEVGDVVVELMDRL